MAKLAAVNRRGPFRATDMGNLNINFASEGHGQAVAELDR